MNAGTSLRLLSIAVTLALSVGCTYVTQADREEHFDSLDEDGDGVTKGDKDCDDNDATRSPLLDEIPYDGIDNNCDGTDLIDVDGDGYPGILESDWTAVSAGVEWPGDVEAERDCADDPEIIADARNIFPGKTSDPAYDGLDSDCAGDNDYDVDGDGDMPPGYESDYAAYTELWGISATGSFTDCDDFDNTTFGGAPNDVWYDGVDTDCAGNNDFDQDADGYMPDESSNAAEYADFLTKFHSGIAPASFGAAAWGDCLDADDINRPGVSASTVFPTATDTWYDGVDSDCTGNNDFDQDADGWIQDTHVSDYQSFLSQWGYADTAMVGDCLDGAADGQINPGMLEILDDSIDSDCDGGDNTAPFGYADLAWTAPRPPAIATTTDHFVLVTAADEFEVGGLPNTNAGVALVFERTVGANADYLGNAIIWQGQGSEDPIGAAVDVVATGDEFWASTVYTRADLNQSFLIAKSYGWDTGNNVYSNGATDVWTASPAFEALDVDIALDNADKPWAWATGGNRVHTLHGNNTFGSDDGSQQALTGATHVFLNSVDTQASTATACTASDCQTLSFNGAAFSLSPTQDFSGYELTYAASHGNVWVLASTNFGLLLDDGSQTNAVLPGTDILHADAIDYNGVLYIAAVVNGAGSEVTMVHGDPVTGVFTTTILPIVADRPLLPTGVAIHVDADRLMLAVSAIDGSGDDAVGWVFLAP